MSSSTNSDVVKFVLHHVYDDSAMQPIPYPALTDEESRTHKFLILSGLFEEDEEYEDSEINFKELLGWTKSEDFVNVGKRKRISAFQWTKDNFKIYAVNTSQYAEVGDISLAVCADDKASIDEFIKDFGPFTKHEAFYEENDTISQTF